LSTAGKTMVLLRDLGAIKAPVPDKEIKAKKRN
jgi:hypothetical protein